MADSGYRADLFMKFVDLHGVKRDDGQYTHFNDQRLSEWHRTMLARWATLDVIPLDKADRFLMRYGLMTQDFEQWAPNAYIELVK